MLLMVLVLYGNMLCGAVLRLENGFNNTYLHQSIRAAVEAVVSNESTLDKTLTIFGDGSSDIKPLLKIKDIKGLTVFEVCWKDPHTELMELEFDAAVYKARQVVKESWGATVMVVSDAPEYLDAFGRWASKGHLLESSLRLIVLTSLPLDKLRRITKLRKLLSKRMSVVFIIEKSNVPIIGVFAHGPHLVPQGRSVKIAYWTPSSIKFIADPSQFSQTFTKFSEQPRLVCGTVQDIISETKVSPGPLSRLADYLAQGINFTYVYKAPSRPVSGTKQPNGSWTGLVGMVLTEEVDFTSTVVTVKSDRAEVIDYTWPVDIGSIIIIGGRRRPEVDPWGFLLPLTPTVWAATMASLLAFLGVTLALACISPKISVTDWQVSDISNYVRVILQQDIVTLAEWWWWEQMVLGLWLLTTLVLTRSYSGNLMSLLAVRHIPQPYHTLSDILEDPAATLIWMKGSSIEQHIKSASKGIYRDIGTIESQGRARRMPAAAFRSSVRAAVRRGPHLVMIHDSYQYLLTGKDSSAQKRCDFYRLRERLLPYLLSTIVPKGSVLKKPMSRRILSLTEAGLYHHWLLTTSLKTRACLNPPTTYTVNTILALTSLWGLFVMLAAGHLFGFLAWMLECLVAMKLKLGRNLNRASA